MEDAEESFVFSFDAIETSEDYITEELDLLGDDDLCLLVEAGIEAEDETE